MILVTGAAGKTGRAVIRKLSARGLAVRALVHRHRHRAVVERLGVDQIAEGDLEDREALARAVRGIDSICHICPNVHPDEVGIGRRVIAAARQAAVRRFVFHSVLHPGIEAMPHHWAKLRVEEQLFGAGLEFTILQPAPYMQNVLGQWSSIVEEGVYSVPYGLETRVAMVDLEEIAEAAARVLSEPGHAGATYELCGPDLLDQREIATVLSETLGRPVRARSIPRSAWAEQATGAGVEPFAIETLRAMFRYYERFGMAGSPRVLGWLLGRPPTGFSDFTKRLADRPAPR